MISYVPIDHPFCLQAIPHPIRLNENINEEFKIEHTEFKQIFLQYYYRCFADDLLTFSDGSNSSIQGILTVLHEFKQISGLAISPEKSCFFSSGLTHDEKAELHRISGIPSGSLPIRYLGLPLCTKKLLIINCEPLLQSIKSKISSWPAKYLSFAGRLLLINTVLSGIINFWCSAFILPKKCVKLINSMCSSYLRKGSIESRHNARISWESLTFPKDEGGLGLRNILPWNRTCTLKLFWLLLFRTESIWVAWIHQNVIKYKSFWGLKPHQNHSWVFKQILKHRHLAINWVKLIHGNGANCNFWTDPWSPFGPLIIHLGHQGPRLTGIHLKSSLASLWRRGSWHLPPARSPQMVQIQAFMSTITLSETSDSWAWCPEGIASNKFCSKQIYNLVREKKPQVTWYRSVWFKRGIPKHKSLTWMVNLNRCPTKDRLLSWNIPVDPACLLCNGEPESRDHLFFSCSFSSAIWSTLSAKLRLPVTSPSWNPVLQTIIALPASNHLTYLTNLAWQASIYEIWAERNGRLHRESFKSSESILHRIDHIIRDRIASFRHQNPTKASNYLQLWFSLP